MTKENWMKSGSMKNLDLKDDSGVKQIKKKSKNAEHQVIKDVIIDPTDKNRLKGVMTNELSYYNILVDGMHSRMKTRPELLLSIVDDYEKLFSTVAQYGKNVKEFTHKKPEDLPEYFQEFENILFEKQKKLDGTVREKFALDDSMVTLFELAAARAQLLPSVRKAMATEILRFYRDNSSSEIKKASKDQQLLGEKFYQNSFSFLEKMDSTRKRSVQIINPYYDKISKTRIIFNEEKEQTEIYCAYCANPIILQGINAITDKLPWKLMIISQGRGGVPAPSDPWEVELHWTNSWYLVKHYDTTNPYATSYRRSRVKNTGSNTQQDFSTKRMKSNYGMTTKDWRTYT